MIYTVKINTLESDPEKCCSYLNDAKKYIKGSDDWDNALIFKDIKPCLFSNGIVTTYLYKNNFLLNLDKNPILINKTDDFMIEFPYFGFQIFKENNYIYVSITDEYNKKNFNYSAFSRNKKNDLKHFYHGAFKGYIDDLNILRSIIGVQPTAYHTITDFREAAKKHGKNYHQTLFSHITAIQCLYLIKYCNLDGQIALGKGYCEAENSKENNSKITGGTIFSGMNYGDTIDGLKQVKLFGIEDFWGNIWEWVDDIFIDENYTIINQSNNLNYNIQKDIILNNNFTKTSVPHPHGYTKQVLGKNIFGFLPIEWTENKEGYWNTYSCLYPNSICHFGDRWDSQDRTGPFRFGFHSDGDVKNRIFGGRLCYH